MNKCAEIQELISEYLDGELSSEDTARVDEHLAQCEQCSALLMLFSEINTSIRESLVPPPEKLLTGVMDKIRSGYKITEGSEDENSNDFGDSGVLYITDIRSRGNSLNSSREANDDSHEHPDVNSIDSSRDSSHEGKPKEQITHMLLTRILPLAACIAIVLFSLPRIGGIFGFSGAGGSGSSQNTNSGSSSRIMSEVAPSGGSSSAGSDAGGGTGSTTGGNSGNTTNDDAGVNIHAEDATIDTATSYDTNSETAEADSPGGIISSSGSASIINPAEGEVSFEAPSASTGSASLPITPGATTAQESGVSATDSPALIDENSGEGTSGGSDNNPPSTGSGVYTENNMNTGDNEGTGEIPNEISPTTAIEKNEELELTYYAIITITNQLPQILKSLDLHIIQIDDYTQHFVISREIAIQLIEADESITNVTDFDIYNENSEIAYVMFFSKVT